MNAQDNPIKVVTKIETAVDDGSLPDAMRLGQAMNPLQIIQSLEYLDPEDLKDVIRGLQDAYSRRWSPIVVPLDQVGPSDHVLGHVGLTDRGYKLLKGVLADATLNAHTDRASELEELSRHLTSD